jgi:6-phosphogluconolactonase
VKQLLRWHIYPTGEDLAERAAQAVIRCAAQAIAERGLFRIVLAGGATPRSVYSRLRSREADWNAWHVYFGDERWLPAGDPGRNDTMARENWLGHVPVPQTQIHCVSAGGEPSQAARAYSRLVAGVDLFDLVLLGLGEDGHTASLFPGRDPGASESAAAALLVEAAPKPPPRRISLGAHRLSMARQVIFLVTGASKRGALSAWRQGFAIPARHITPAAGVDLFVDRAAMPIPGRDEEAERPPD